MSVNKKKHSTMSYYSIASTTVPIHKLACKITKYYPKTVISPSLYYYWTEIMLQCRNIPNWTQLNIIFHPYRLLYHNLPNEQHCFTKIGDAYTPIFYEILETISNMNLHFENLYKCNGLHLGENSENIKQAFLHNYPLQAKNHICYPGMFQNSFIHILSNHSSIDLVTLSSNGKNEYSYTVDILKQMCIGLSVQKTKGVMIFNINTIFHSLTIDLLFLVCSLYDKVYITKPLCSNPCELSKYIVCKGFKKQTKKEVMIEYLQRLYFDLCNRTTEEYVERILNITIPIYFTNKLEELNSIFGQPCMEQVQNVLINQSDTRTEKINADSYKCLEWCAKHNVMTYEHNTIPKGIPSRSFNSSLV